MNRRPALPPLLSEIADHAAEVLLEIVGLPREQAEHAGFEIMRRIAEVMGGAQVYIPKPDTLLRHERDQAIWREFDGRNQHELARKYGVSVIWIYSVIRRMRAANRGGA